MAERPKPEELILYEKDPKTKIATITFNRPEYLNAPTSAARLRYADLLRVTPVASTVHSPEADAESVTGTPAAGRPRVVSRTCVVSWLMR
jgi:hypothetical protein